MHYFSLFYIKSYKPCACSRICTKNTNYCDIYEKDLKNFQFKFNREIEFLTIFSKVEAKTKDFQMTSFFYNIVSIAENVPAGFATERMNRFVPEQEQEIAPGRKNCLINSICSYNLYK